MLEGKESVGECRLEWSSNYKEFQSIFKNEQTNKNNTKVDVINLKLFWNQQTPVKDLIQ